MSRALKTVISVLFILLLCVPITALAAEEVVVGGGEFSIGYVKNSAFSVNIKNNSGIMGYKIFVGYDTSAIKVTSVDRGSVTKSGNFSTNFDTPGKIIVVWNDTSQKTGDGSLFDVSFEVLNPQKDTEVTLSYSEADTFNEKYEKVPLKTENILLKGAVTSDIVSSDVSENQGTESRIETQPGTEIEPDYAKIVSALKELFKKYDLDNLAPEDTSKILSEAGATVDKVSGTTGQTFSSLESLNFFYSQAKINATEQEIKNSGKQKTVDKIVSEKLEKFDVESFSKLPKEEQKKAVEEIKKAIASENNEAFDDLTDDEWLDTVNQTASKREKPKENGKNTKTVFIIAICILVISGLATFLIIYINKRRKKNEKI